ncbi:MAG: nucleotidyltransferase domain-containing protein [Thermoplasmata archaeon]|nr:nucleotidyltransferase domain-containing protein [Thermoplasmata archaeon]
MDRREKIVQGLKRFRDRMSEHYPIAELILFGSMAGEEPREESDIDLIIVSERFKGMNFLKRAARAYDYWDLEYPVDFLCYTPHEFEERKRRIGLVAQAIKEGIAI